MKCEFHGAANDDYESSFFMVAKVLIRTDHNSGILA